MGQEGQIMGSAAAIRSRARALARYDQRQPHGQTLRGAAAVFADLSALYRLLPPNVRARDPDPERLGVRRMHAMLAVLGSRPR